MSEATLEKVKIEIRALLLSSKHGVPADSIQYDYESLMCQRLPLKELGFRDVQSLMRAIPDVAEEARSSMGEVTYHAVCDDTTAHIQKMVSRQVTKKKKKTVKSPARKWKGHGSGYLGRGGRPPGRRGILGDSPKLPTVRSRPPHVTNRRHPEKVSLPYGDSRDNTSNKWGSSQPVDLPDHNRQYKKFHSRSSVDPSSPQSDSDTESYKNKSPVYNLKIGISQTGKREIVKQLQPLRSNGDASSGTPAAGFDLRDFLNRRRAEAASVKSHVEQVPRNINRHSVAATVGSESVIDNRVTKENRAYAKNLPPRLQRAQRQSSPAQEQPVLSPVQTGSEDFQKHFNHENTVYSMDCDNWLPPKDGEMYLEAFKSYFSHRKEVAPEVEIIPGKLKKQKGFYGRLRYQDKYYYPLEIMETEELARQNVVRTFCLKSGISLPPKEQNEVSTSHSSPNVSPSVQEKQQPQSNVTNSHPPPKQNVCEPPTSCQQQVVDAGTITASPHKTLALPATLEKVYKILKPNGIWLSELPKLYQAAYGESLAMDLLSVVTHWPQYFTLEKLAGDRYTIYPVANNLSEQPKIETSTGQIVVPPALQPDIGSRLQVLFSFAYSAEDVYLQRADMENIVYELDDVLTKGCPGLTPPPQETIALNSLLAACYQEGWYRAQVLAVEKTATVYFIDYGNKEKVNLVNLRPVPQHPRILNTPSLAIKCALRKTKAGEWFQDVIGFLTDLSETDPIFSAVIVEHKGDRCIVDLYTSDERLVNDMLLQSVPSPGPQQLESVTRETESKGQETTVPEKNTRRMSASATRLFADDPEPLVIPDSDEFAVYVCRVMSENTVLLRIVDDEYSDKLDELEQEIADNFYSWSIPEKIRQSNIYACMVLADAEEAEGEEYDEEGSVRVSDQNKYHRVRVLKEHEDGSCECYLPDHGHNETMHRSQLRDIDPQLNSSLSYQAVMARLHGLDSLADNMKPMAVRMWIQLLTNGVTYYAVKRGKSAEKSKSTTAGADVIVTNRVRKILSCIEDIEPGHVAKIYLDVFKEPLNNVEDVIKNIPGYGYWKEILEIDLYDTSSEDTDININDYVLATIQEMVRVQSSGGSVEEVFQELFSSDISQTDTDAGSAPEELDDWAGSERVKDNVEDRRVNSVGVEAKPDHVVGCPQGLTVSTVTDDSIKAMSGKTLYTWHTKPASSDGGVGGAAATDTSGPVSTTAPIVSAVASFCDNNSCLPKFWSYPLLKFVSLYVISVESPSDFVAIPMEQRGALGKLEVAIAEYLSVNKAAAPVCRSNLLYAVKSKDAYRRAVYLGQAGDMVKVFLPDHHCYVTVPLSELLLLPEQFYSLPFLARRMYLGGVLPTGKDWPASVIQWFKSAVFNKCLFALFAGEDSQRSNQGLPGTLAVHLIDTSGSDDLVFNEYMENQGMAVRDSGTV